MAACSTKDPSRCSEDLAQANKQTNGGMDVDYWASCAPGKLVKPLWKNCIQDL